MSRTNWRFPRRKQRRIEAAERQTYYDGLTAVDKIASAVSSPGNSRRQFKRFADAAEKEGADEHEINAETT